MKLLIDNEKRKLSRNKKRKLERIIKMDDKMKSLLNKIKTERKNIKTLIKLKS